METNETRRIIESRSFLLKLFDQVNSDKQKNKNFNSPIKFLELDMRKQEKLVEYCLSAFVPSHRANRGSSSYGMKHNFEKLPQGFYTYNGQFKGAMLIAGYLPVNPHEINWYYKVDKGCYGANTYFAGNRTLSRQTKYINDLLPLTEQLPLEKVFSSKVISQCNAELANGFEEFK